MKILIAYPDVAGVINGNQVTAQRWRAILKELGHEVETTATAKTDLASENYDLLIALHAIKSAGVIEEFRETSPDKPIVVAITGTDIYSDQDSAILKKSLETAAKIVVLQQATAKDVSPIWQAKVRTIYQSVTNIGAANLDGQNNSQGFAQKKDETFAVLVASNLRQPKDPFLTAIAVRNLPSDSKIQVTHLGAAMSDEMQSFAEQETINNSRYHWAGSLSHQETLNAIAQSDLLVNSSKVEGGSAVISEAIAANTPILATRIAGNRGLLGDDYSGMFEVGDTNQLRTLLLEAEQKGDFFDELKRQCKNRKHLITPKFERETWANLLNELKI